MPTIPAKSNSKLHGKVSGKKRNNNDDDDDYDEIMQEGEIGKLGQSIFHMNKNKLHNAGQNNFANRKPKSSHEDELLLAEAFELEWPITSLLHCKVEKRFRGESDRRVLVHRCFYVAKLASDVSPASALHYLESAVQKVAEMSPNGQLLEPLTGMGLVYPTQTLHTVEGSADALLNYLSLIDPKGKSPFSIVKVVVFAHDISMRCFSTWVIRIIDIAAAIVIGGDSPENAEPVTKTAADLIGQVVRMATFIQETPPERVKSVLDNLHEKAGQYLPAQDTIATLLSTNDRSIRSASDFVQTFKRPVLDAFATDMIWPRDLNVTPQNWSLMTSEPIKIEGK